MSLPGAAAIHTHIPLLLYTRHPDVKHCYCCCRTPCSYCCGTSPLLPPPPQGRSAMLLLKNRIMPAVLLRRTKVQCADDLALPPRQLLLRKDRFDVREADFYEALYTQSQAQVGGVAVCMRQTCTTCSTHTAR